MHNSIIFFILLKQYSKKLNRAKLRKERKTSCKQKLLAFEGKKIAFQILTVIKRHFPDLVDQLSQLWDYRKNPEYPAQEIYMACISMFLFKRGSRNSMNNTSEKGAFCENYAKLFGVHMPHMDTVNIFMTQCDPAYLEEIKHKMVQCLLNKKVFNKFRLDGRYLVAVDATGISSYDYEPWTGCPFKDYKSGRVWMVPILEIKLVCANGFSISLYTKWILNTESYKKQSCEQTAFAEVAEEFKKCYPRLPITLLADGLYPNNTVFNICEQYGWNFIITLKDGNLKSLWEEIDWQLRIAKDNTVNRILLNKPKHKLKQICRFLNRLAYGDRLLNWIECVEKETIKDKTTENRFVHITNISANKDNVCNLSQYARQRWKIENEGFDNQKNHGYALKHKYSRKSLNARQNYYQCLQIAHLINQLAEKSQSLVKQLHKKETSKSLWECLIAFLWLGNIESGEVENIKISNCQLRY